MTMEERFDIAYRYCLPTIHCASNNYFRGGNIALRITPEDIAQELALFLWECVEKIDLDVNSVDFRKIACSLLWKRAWRIVAQERRGKRDARLDVHIERVELENQIFAVDRFMPNRALDSLVFDDYARDICAGLDKIDRRIFADMIEPSDKCLKMFVKLTRDKRFKVEQRGIPLKWLWRIHSEMYGVTRQRFYNGVATIKARTAVVLGIGEEVEK